MPSGGPSSASTSSGEPSSIQSYGGDHSGRAAMNTHVPLGSDGDCAGGGMQLGHRRALVGEQPRGSDQRVTSEGELDRGGQDLHLARRGVIDEDRLAEAQVDGDRLTLCLGTSAPSRNTPSGLPKVPSAPVNTRSTCNVATLKRYRRT